LKNYPGLLPGTSLTGLEGQVRLAILSKSLAPLYSGLNEEKTLHD